MYFKQLFSIFDWDNYSLSMAFGKFIPLPFYLEQKQCAISFKLEQFISWVSILHGQKIERSYKNLKNFSKNGSDCFLALIKRIHHMSQLG